MKYKNKTTGIYKSELEKNCSLLLKENSIPYEYEKHKILLQDKVKLDLISLEKGKIVKTLRKITYTPDFVGSNWIIETKGKRTPDFNIKWKLFLNKIDPKYKLVCIAANKKQINECINQIKNL
jgi:hypothetical protein